MPYPKQKFRAIVFAIASAVVGISVRVFAAEDNGDLRREVEQLRSENKSLRSHVQDQETVVQSLTRRLDALEKKSANDEKAAESDNAAGSAKSSFSFGRINISGEGGLAIFDSEKSGQFPNAEFRVDEAKLFVESPVWGDVYFFSELNLAARNSSHLNLNVGELYLDFEDVSKLWGKDRQLNVRVGRLDIPFGEEYLQRDVIDNPLISHSVSDIWGVDEGVELYGSFGKFGYVVAVQNGGPVAGRDFTKDKSVAGRIYFDPNPTVHLSLSAMRTGDMDAANDYWSENWFGGGWFESIGGTNTTRYHVNLLQGDTALKFKRGKLKAFAGGAWYDDNDSAADNNRDFFYYGVEGVLDVTKQFYAAARWSQIVVKNGYPLPGNGDQGAFYFNPFGPQSRDLWRFTFGLGYRFNSHLVIKADYSLEGGRETSGASRKNVNMFAAEAAFGF